MASSYALSYIRSFMGAETPNSKYITLPYEQTGHSGELFEEKKRSRSPCSVFISLRDIFPISLTSP